MKAEVSVRENVGLPSAPELLMAIAHGPQQRKKNPYLMLICHGIFVAELSSIASQLHMLDQSCSHKAL
ncbi:protein of unknown function [Candidatus Filomicrobium marinum]|uniref:Uncharacterized protein n=1 Tax=Candidatus Filomicrobium marinum TaxID=1608628 RepID=A0A0D6JA79_9HYPH|nr:protein of unknown function [Candidatus Filomicrobium marinum]CPR15346.1 protein of unknown function [Candidatus Filomicrobium marinum]